MWNLDEAVHYLRCMNADAKRFGWCFALGGGVLNHGYSKKDLDIVAIPYHGAGLTGLYDYLRRYGMVQIRTSSQMRSGWKEPDMKHVEEWRTDTGRRIDIMIMIVPSPYRGRQAYKNFESESGF